MAAQPERGLSAFGGFLQSRRWPLLAEAVWKLTAESIVQPRLRPIGDLSDNDSDRNQARSASIKG